MWKFFVLMLLSSSIWAENTTVPSPYCSDSTSTCEVIEHFLISDETGKTLNIQWQPIGACNYCDSTEYTVEVRKYPLDGLVMSNIVTDTNLPITLNSAGKYYVKVQGCWLFSNTDANQVPGYENQPKACADWSTTLVDAADDHGFIIDLKLDAPGGGGIE